MNPNRSISSTNQYNFSISTNITAGEYNVQELQNKISLLTDRCQSAERERKEARRERDESVKQLREVCGGDDVTVREGIGVISSLMVRE